MTPVARRTVRREADAERLHGPPGRRMRAHPLVRASAPS
jgi:hypothetical protein